MCSLLKFMEQLLIVTDVYDTSFYTMFFCNKTKRTKWFPRRTFRCDNILVSSIIAYRVFDHEWNIYERFTASFCETPSCESLWFHRQTVVWSRERFNTVVNIIGDSFFVALNLNEISHKLLKSLNWLSHRNELQLFAHLQRVGAVEHLPNKISKLNRNATQKDHKNISVLLFKVFYFFVLL